MNKLLHGDCLELLKTVPDGSIDLVITDPPYGDNIGYGRKEKEILNNEDETINYRVIPHLYDKLKDGGVCYLFTNWKFSPSIQAFVEDNTKFKLRMQIVIVKNNIGMGYGFRNQYELCLVLEKGDVKYNNNDFSNVLKMEHINHTDNTHPHEKGLVMLQKMILHSSQEGDTVLDCFAGSGSTLVAASLLKRNYIGMELDKRWFDWAQTRLDMTTNTLF